MTISERTDFMLIELRDLEKMLSNAGNSDVIPPTFYDEVENKVVKFLKQLYSIRMENVIASASFSASSSVSTSTPASVVSDYDIENEYSLQSKSEKTNESIPVSILNDKHTANSLNEAIENHLYKDIRKGIGLNDGFRFLRELFGGDSEKMNKTLNGLNEADSFEAAVSYLYLTLNWNVEDPAVADFMNILEKHYA